MTPLERVTFELPSAEEDLLSVELWARGAVGLEMSERDGTTRIEAYFEVGRLSAEPLAAASWAARGIRQTDRSAVAERDWLADYRRLARPFDVGTRLRIDPGEPDGPPPASASDRLLLRVPAWRAFGTGSHESTRLLLEWIEELELAPRRILDVGTGSGVVSLAALRLGAGSVVALDVDPTAVLVARQIAALNGIRLPLVAGSLDCLRRRRFDLVLLNILPVEWVDELGAVERCLAPGGEALLSGASVDDEEMLEGRLAARRWRIVERRRRGDWRALRARPR